MAEKISRRLREMIITRAKGRCQYCMSLMKYSPQPFVIEHVVPLAMKGKTTFDNLALACGGCNGHKYTKTEGMDPVSGESASLFHPIQESWSTHFAWDYDYLKIIGLTPTGRATVSALLLNRAGLIHLRTITKMTGEHPPD